MSVNPWWIYGLMVALSMVDPWPENTFYFYVHDSGSHLATGQQWMLLNNVFRYASRLNASGLGGVVVVGGIGSWSSLCKWSASCVVSLCEWNIRVKYRCVKAHPHTAPSGCGTHLEAQTRSLPIVKIRFYIVTVYYVKPYLYYGQATCLCFKVCATARRSRVRMRL